MDSRPVVIITGATNGLGRLAALDLARRSAQLGIVARSQKKANELRQEIAAVAPGTSVESFIADLASLREVHRVGREIDARSKRITVDGFAEMTAVNYLAPWLLTNTLRDKLVASAPARVVTVVSEAAGSS